MMQQVRKKQSLKNPETIYVIEISFFSWKRNINLFMKLYNKSAKLFKQLTFVYWEG